MICFSHSGHRVGKSEDDPAKRARLGSLASRLWGKWWNAVCTVHTHALAAGCMNDNAPVWCVEFLVVINIELVAQAGCNLYIRGADLQRDLRLNVAGDGD